MIKIHPSHLPQKDYAGPLFPQSRPSQPTSQHHQSRKLGNPIHNTLLAVPVLKIKEQETQHLYPKKLCLGNPETKAPRRRSHLRRSVGETHCLLRIHIRRKKRGLQGNERVVEIREEDISRAVRSRGEETRKAEAHKDEMVDGGGCLTIDQAELRTNLLALIT